MITITEVSTKRDKRRFVDFPIKLYKGIKQFVPPLRMDELNLFNPKKNVSYDDCEVAYFIAEKNKTMVGRIAAIKQNRFNNVSGEKRVRFTRFDCINDVEVAKKLFKAVETWAKQKNMQIVHGPMGFNDQDREGMLIEGFDEVATFEEQYNFEYYKDLMEVCGYKKEVDWKEFSLTVPKVLSERILRISHMVEKRFELKVAPKTSKKTFLDKYKKQMFELLDKTYGSLYGFVPYTDKMRDQLISQFNLVINLDFVTVVLDQEENVIAFGFAIPSLSEAVNKIKGKLLPFGFIKLLKAIKNPKSMDLALIAVDPNYFSKGVNSIIMREMHASFAKHKIEKCETNSMLETNLNIHQMWKHFEYREHKRRRSWIKYI